MIGLRTLGVLIWMLGPVDIIGGLIISMKVRKGDKKIGVSSVPLVKIYM